MSITKLFKERRDYADEEIISFLSGEPNYNVIIFDTETNGLYRKDLVPSVLSISAIKGTIISKDYFSILGHYNRFYFPVEDYNPEALYVNGLTKRIVEELRGDLNYPKYFVDDVEAFKEFCMGYHLFIGHNAKDFDCKFIPINWGNLKVFDTMKSNTDIVCSSWNDYYHNWKTPKLKETVSFYGISLEESKLHGSAYDTEMTLKIFMAMLKRSTVRLKNFKERNV